MMKQTFGISLEQIDYYRNYIFQNNSNIDCIISRLLSVLGFKPSLYGTDFLMEAIKYYLLLPAMTKVSFGKNVYPAVAGVFGTSAKCVDRNIHTAIENCYNEGNLFLLNALCGYEVVFERYPPTNVDLVTKAANWIKTFPVALIG